ncbi:uncharacterized protein EV422DRAFT_534273 [Fimicolochytrium jonesii]|uniref:uncharacterized protein n=1 Tax=Fimicolochytrium jonesii TaxID=1396493 RepID=UPI0022FE4D6B|nr:uncharacterized protein EV422DRAFT_534273 [Fimicolochytrium jonesii]KAI8819299.1 hypothetical protein EV422DRAFT_534273 [Fimicolochytrium jonesii]
MSVATWLDETSLAEPTNLSPIPNGKPRAGRRKLHLPPLPNGGTTIEQARGRAGGDGLPSKDDQVITYLRRKKRIVTNVCSIEKRLMYRKLRNNRYGFPLETMLPRLRAGDILSFVPETSVMDKTGITSLINRGFLPADADYSPVLSIDSTALQLDKQTYGSLEHIMSLNKPPSKFDYLRLVPLTPPQPPEEPHVNRQFPKTKKTRTTAALDAHWNHTGPALRPRFKIVLDVPLETKPHPTATPPPSQLAPSRDENAPFTSTYNLFTIEQERVNTARLIAASRKGPVLTVQGGKIVRHVPVFAKFQKSCEDNWCAVEWVLEKIEDLMQQYAVPYTEIISTHVKELAQAPLGPHVDRNAILDCLVNSAEVQQIMTTDGQRFRGKDGHNMAAGKIQATFKMWIMRRMQFWHLERVRAAGIFLKYWKIKMMRRDVQLQAKVQYEKVHVRRFHRLMSTLKHEIGSVATHKRTYIQLVPSKVLGDLHEMGADINLGRAHFLVDSLAETIFVTSYVDEERIDRFRKTLGSGFPDHNPLDENRIRFVVPEAGPCFPADAPIASMLICSRRALANLKRMCQGKNAILLCDVIGEAEVRLSSVLGIPVLGPTLDAYEKYLSSRGRTREFLRSIGVPVVPALTSHAINEKEVHTHIMKCMSMFPEVPLWTYNADPSMKRVETHENDGPWATLDTDHVSFVPDLYEPSQPVSEKPSKPGTATGGCPTAIDGFNPRSRPVTAPESEPPERPFTATTAGLGGSRPRTAMAGSIAANMSRAREEVPLKVRVVYPSGTWPGLIERWLKGGAYIMGYPTSDPRDVRQVHVGIDLSPSGRWKPICVAQVLLNRHKLTSTAVVIQHGEAKIHEDLKPTLDKIAEACAEKSIVGLLTIEFLTWDTGDVHNYWACHIRPHLSAALLRAATVLLATGCKTDLKDWKAKFLRQDVPLHVRFAQGARFMDQSRIRPDFHSKKILSVGIAESRASIYLHTLEHGQVGVMTRKAAATALKLSGVDFDIWTRTGTLFFEQDAPWRGVLAHAVVANDYNTALDNCILGLLKMNQYLDECAAECTDMETYKNNFLAVASRLLYEAKAHKGPRASVTEEPGDASVYLKEAYRDLGLLPPATVQEELELFAAVYGSSSNIRGGHANDEDADSETESDADDLDLVNARGGKEMLERATSARATSVGELSTLIGRFYRVTKVERLRPTSAALRRRQEAANLRKALRAAGFSSTTTALLNEDISSDFAARHDETFANPPLSPPYVRKKQGGKGEAGRTKRARELLEKMETEMDKQLKRGIVPEGPVYRMKIVEEVDPRDAMMAAALLEGEGPILPPKQPLPPMPELVDGDFADAEVVPNPAVRSSAFGLNHNLDVEQVLGKLRDVADRGERLSSYLDEKMLESEKILRRHHAKHLEYIEKGKSDAEAREAQSQALKQRNNPRRRPSQGPRQKLQGLSEAKSVDELLPGKFSKAK